ncbi:MAG: M20/M25/M40 family metallo-hydrolase [Thermomicrobiales bacterium]|nr:M20/M25/M40 family metallo-hydrolase [Thermomicrobiales bacterium]
MNDRSLDFLHQLLDSPGPSGFEERPSRVWRTRAAEIGATVTHDVLGNSYANLPNKGQPVVVIEGHIDEIGLMITHVDDEGYCWIDQIGGWDVPVLLGQRVLVMGESGDVNGVIGRKAAHLLEAEDRKATPELRHLWIDIGAANREEALQRVQVGDPVVVDAGFRQLSEDRIVSRSLDNRVGAFVALEALRLLAESPSNVDAFALAATREEVNFAGAFAAAFAVKADVTIVIDVTHTADYPDSDKRRQGDVKIGGGPVLSRGAAMNDVAYKRMKSVAESEGIPYQLQASPGDSHTDADAIVTVAGGSATMLVSIPNRYMHSPNELVSLTDLENAAKLIAAFVRSIDASTDFRP